MPNLHGPEATFELGKAITLMDGDDVTFVATGETVAPAFLAAQKLAKEGIACRVISMHTLKPFDTEALLYAASHAKALITVEEHSVFGGLGGICAETLMQAGVFLPFKIVGFPDEYMVSGSQTEIFNHYGISADGLAQTARQLL
jgi:transketolase